MKAQRAYEVCIALMVMIMLAGCAHDGALVTFGYRIPTTLRATDQSILADAIDDAFEKFDTKGMKAKLRSAKASNAYLIIASTFELSEATRDYIQLRAGLKAGELGIGILEVVRSFEHVPPARQWVVLKEEYPDTVARVLMLVSYAGVDEVETPQQQVAHAANKPDRIFKGRFKGTFAVVPRKSAFPAVVQHIEGESQYEIMEGKYLDRRVAKE